MTKMERGGNEKPPLCRTCDSKESLSLCLESSSLSTVFPIPSHWFVVKQDSSDAFGTVTPLMLVIYHTVERVIWLNINGGQGGYHHPCALHRFNCLLIGRYPNCRRCQGIGRTKLAVI